MHEITELEKFNSVLLENKYVVVDFFATWCGPCKAIKPFFIELSTNEKYKNVYFCIVDIDKAPEIASTCDVSSLPTFLFYKDSENVDELIGANKTELQKKLDNLISK
jgi:thioredoxin 1